MSPEGMKKGQETWMEWANKCGSNLVELGTQLVDGQKLTKSGSLPTDSSIEGYSILQADDIEGEQALFEGHPHLQWMEDTEIDVYEMASM